MSLGPIVSKIEVVIKSATLKPIARIFFNNAAGLSLLPAQGCVGCCNQSREALREPSTPFLFEVMNRAGNWLPAIGSVSGQQTVDIVPLNNVTCEAGHSRNNSLCWLSGVRSAVLDIPQCALYNEAGLPAAPFEFAF